MSIRTGREDVVEEERGSARIHSACKRHSGLLTARQIHTALADLGIVAILEGFEISEQCTRLKVWSICCFRTSISAKVI